MEQKNAKNARICRILCIALLLVLFAVQLTPYWQINDKTEAIYPYCWNPHGNADLKDYFAQQIPEYQFKSAITLPTLLFWGCIFSIALVAILREKWIAALGPMACGVIGCVNYLTNPILKLSGTWVTHLVFSIALVLVSAAMLYFQQKKKTEK